MKRLFAAIALTLCATGAFAQEPLSDEQLDQEYQTLYSHLSPKAQQRLTQFVQYRQRQEMRGCTGNEAYDDPRCGHYAQSPGQPMFSDRPQGYDPRAPYPYGDPREAQGVSTLDPRTKAWAQQVGKEIGREIVREINKSRKGQ